MPHAPSTNTAIRVALLCLLGLLWAVRIASIKAAGLAGVPGHVTVLVMALGLAAIFTVRAFVARDWPPMDRSVIGFYGATALLGFLAPFAVEAVVAPRLPVFVLTVVIATMPILALVLSAATGGERLTGRSILSVSLGFACALALLAGGAADADSASWVWIAAAFGVPLCYAANTVFVASRWPARAEALHVAQAQAVIVAVAALLGSLATGKLGDLRLAALHAPALALIVAGEALALLVYLRITRVDGATWVSFANYVSMAFGAAIGALAFGDAVTPLTVAAALGIAASVALYRRPA